MAVPFRAARVVLFRRYGRRHPPALGPRHRTGVADGAQRTSSPPAGWWLDS
jgi:hypothetical protein